MTNNKYNDDLFVGGEKGDFIQGLSGDDAVYGKSGDDILLGNQVGTVFFDQGEDVIDGGDGDDIIIDYVGLSTIAFAGTGNDLVQSKNNTADRKSTRLNSSH